MEVSQSSMMSFLGKPHVEFTIPPYQRLYSWTEAQCEELWLDTLRAARKKQNHFAGTLLYNAIEEEPSFSKLEIIDGQQRITSISLIILALSRFLDAHPDQARESSLNGETLRKEYLLTHAPHSKSESMKLIPSRHDVDEYAAVINGVDSKFDQEEQSTIRENLNYFEEQMRGDGFNPQQLMEGLMLLSVIMVKVDDIDESQLIFESINSKGMSLNVADMIRNYLLLAENHEEQTRLFEEYWKPSQEMFSPDPGSLKLNAGIKSWLSIRLKSVKVLSADQIYSSFKKFAEDIYQGDKEPILRELRGFCLMWAENYRYHGVKKFKSGSNWAELGAPTLTSGYKLKKADNEEYAEQFREKLRNADSRW